MENRTIRALADITDDALFEKIATSVLRLTPGYARIIQLGLTVEGKTRKAPVDGICYSDASGLNLVHVQHTTTKADLLRGKWLLDPAAVKQRKGTRSKPVAGDLIKSIELVRKERTREPAIKGTAVLTTNQEPDQQLVNDTVSVARTNGLAVDIWSRSRIAQILDTDARGQLIRRQLLGFDEELLSGELFEELGVLSVDQFDAGDEPDIRVARFLDRQLGEETRTIAFVVGDSGTGKTVACHRALSTHVAGGGVALIVHDDIAEQSISFDSAIMAALKQLKPSLASDQSALSLLSNDHPLLVMIEDVSRSRQPQRLIERIASWNPQTHQQAKAPPPWRILCPVWPHDVAALPAKLKERISALELRTGLMTPDEAAAAVAAKAAKSGVTLSAERASSLAIELGNDPLLIGLNRDWHLVYTDQIIGQFVASVLETIQHAGSALAPELHAGLLALGANLLLHRSFDPSWRDVESFALSSSTVDAVRTVARDGQILRLEGPPASARLRFRHDRVREWILVEAALDLHSRGQLADEILSDPFVAEVIGSLVARTQAPTELLTKLSALNPLALFHSIREAEPSSSIAERAAASALEWLQAPENRGRSTNQLRWQAAAAIEDVRADFMPALIGEFPSDWPGVQRAKVRNGDLEGAIDLLQRIDLANGYSWLEQPLADAGGPALVTALADLIRHDDGTIQSRRSALLGVAGVIGDPSLVERLRELWKRDEQRLERLDEYLWAFARCVEEDSAEALLAPLFDLWASLPQSAPNESPSPRDELAAHSLRWAFERALPERALNAFIRRAETDSDLSWQIEYAMHGFDHPKAVLFEAERAAARLKNSPESYTFNHSIRDHWRRMAEHDGKRMSDASRNVLRDIWQNRSKDEELRLAAFDIWAASPGQKDLELLKGSADDELLTDRILRQRLERSDGSAISDLVQRLDGLQGRRWWFYARYVWSDDLLDALDRALARDADALDPSASGASSPNEIAHGYVRVILRLTQAEAERLLVKYWASFGTTPQFVQAALYVGTTELLRRAAIVIEESTDPAELLKYISMNWGHRFSGEVGITNEQQILNLEPYLDFLPDSDISILADACNERGWIETRKKFFDVRDPPEQDGTDEAVRRIFDAEMAKGPMSFIEHQLERAEKAGASWPQIIAVLKDWLAAQDSLEALELASRILIIGGSRDDLSILHVWKDEKLIGAPIVADTQFAVERQRP